MKPGRKPQRKQLPWIADFSKLGWGIRSRLQSTTRRALPAKSTYVMARSPHRKNSFLLLLLASVS